MNGFILIVPLLLIRYGIPLFINKDSIVRASHFPTFPKNKQIFLVIYQVTTCLLVIVPFFLKVQIHSELIYVSSFIYALGNIFLIFTVIHFSKPNKHNLNTNGLYRISRNPMYVGYFIYFLGCVLMTESIILFIVLILFQVSCHWLILAEEAWCTEYFGDEYQEYMKKVRRYL